MKGNPPQLWKRGAGGGPATLDLQVLEQIANRVQGQNLADLERCLLVRQGFMQALTSDPTVTCVLRALSASTGLAAALADSQEAAGALSQGGRLHAILDDLAVTGESPTLRQLGEEDLELAETWVSSAENVDGVLRVDQVAPQLLGFVTLVLDLPWPWVVWGLLNHYVIDVGAKIMQYDGVTISVGLKLDDHQGFSFVGRPGETPAQMTERFDREVAQGTEAGRRPRSEDHRQRLAEYGEWFYRHKVCGESIRALAKAYSRRRRGVDQSDDRPTVRRGIEEAQRLLELHEYRFQSHDLPKRDTVKIQKFRERVAAFRVPPLEN